jgi:hypothetical protein
MKTYSPAPDVTVHIDKILAAHHEELDGVTIQALFVFDSESGDHVLNHQGYPAAAVVRITPVKDRALGVADATIIVDRCGWLALSARQRDAVIDHELTHLTRVVDEDSEEPQVDAVERPKLTMRKHDHQFGWFDEVAKRHREASPEVRQARALMTTSGQLYFDFDPPEAPMSATGRTIQAAAAKAERKKRADARPN